MVHYSSVNSRQTFTLHSLLKETLEQLFTVLTNGRLLIVAHDERVWDAQTQSALALHPRHLPSTAGPRLAAQSHLSRGRGRQRQRRPTDLQRQQLYRL